MNDPLLRDIGNENSGMVGDALRQKNGFILLLSSKPNFNLNDKVNMDQNPGLKECISLSRFDGS
jgi:cell division protein FtsI/penicillin-binding protein 2